MFTSLYMRSINSGMNFSTIGLIKSSLNNKESLLVFFLSQKFELVFEKMLNFWLGSRTNLSNFTCGLSTLFSAFSKCDDFGLADSFSNNND